jgi:hypothetical protein
MHDLSEQAVNRAMNTSEQAMHRQRIVRWQVRKKVAKREKVGDRPWIEDEQRMNEG